MTTGRESVRQRVADLARPVTKFLRRRLGRNYTHHPEMELPLGDEMSCLEVERRCHRYLGVPQDSIRFVVMVGAHLAEEIPRMKPLYRNARFLCFEPSPKFFELLRSRYEGCGYVECKPWAVGHFDGETSLFEMSDPGNASILEPDTSRWSELNQRPVQREEVFKVPIKRLDSALAPQQQVDLLFVDVQGAEMKVLEGASQVLRRTKAIFLEVAISGSAYKGAASFQELDDFMRASGFQCVCLGVNPGNYCGNALWIRKEVFPRKDFKD